GEGQGRLEQGGLDVLAASVPLAGQQGRVDAHRGQIGGTQARPWGVVEDGAWSGGTGRHALGDLQVREEGVRPVDVSGRAAEVAPVLVHDPAPCGDEGDVRGPV